MAPNDRVLAVLRLEIEQLEKRTIQPVPVTFKTK